jgi:hypothetical protein
MRIIYAPNAALTQAITRRRDWAAIRAVRSVLRRLEIASPLQAQPYPAAVHVIIRAVGVLSALAARPLVAVGASLLIALRAICDVHEGALTCRRQTCAHLARRTTAIHRVEVTDTVHTHAALAAIVTTELPIHDRALLAHTIRVAEGLHALTRSDVGAVAVLDAVQTFTTIAEPLPCAHDIAVSEAARTVGLGSKHATQLFGVGVTAIPDAAQVTVAVRVQAHLRA